MNPYITYIDEIKNRDIKLFVKTKKFSILLFNGMLNYPLFLSFRHVLDLSFPSKSSCIFRVYDKKRYRGLFKSQRTPYFLCRFY